MYLREMRRADLEEQKADQARERYGRAMQTHAQLADQIQERAHRRDMDRAEIQGKLAEQLDEARAPFRNAAYEESAGLGAQKARLEEQQGKLAAAGEEAKRRHELMRDKTRSIDPEKMRQEGLNARGVLDRASREKIAREKARKRGAGAGAVTPDAIGYKLAEDQINQELAVLKDNLKTIKRVKTPSGSVSAAPDPERSGYLARQKELLAKADKLRIAKATGVPYQQFAAPAPEAPTQPTPQGPAFDVSEEELALARQGEQSMRARQEREEAARTTEETEAGPWESFMGETFYGGMHPDHEERLLQMVAENGPNAEVALQLLREANVDQNRVGEAVLQRLTNRAQQQSAAGAAFDRNASGGGVVDPALDKF
jgi:hypothetical protein